MNNVNKTFNVKQQIQPKYKFGKSFSWSETPVREVLELIMEKSRHLEEDRDTYFSWVITTMLLSWCYRLCVPLLAGYTRLDPKR